MVKVFLLRHAESEYNSIRQNALKKFNLTKKERVLMMGPKFINSETLMDSILSKAGQLQCKIAHLQNKEKLKNVKMIHINTTR